MGLTMDEWERCVDALAAAFGGSCHLVARRGATEAEQEAAEKAGLVWFELLQDLPAGLTLKAVRQVCATTSAFPSVAAIRQAAQALVTPTSSSLPTTEAAWAEACRWVSAMPTWAGGQILQPEPPHPLVAHVVQLLGRDGIRSRTVENEATIRAQFRRAYEPLAQQEAARLAAGVPSLLALEAPPVLLALPAGDHDTEAVQRADAEGRKAFADAAAAEAQRRQQEQVGYQEPAGLRGPEGRVNLEVLRQALGVRPAPARRGPIQGVEPDVDEVKRAAARERLAQRRGTAC